MATFTANQCKKQTASSMRGVIDYVEQEKKTRWGDARLVTGYNCVPQSALAEMQMTKERFRKPGGTQFYHFVQSFSADDNITPQEVNAIGLEFAQRQFPVSAPTRFCSFSANRKCRKMAGKDVQPLNNYTCRFCPSSLKQADKSGLDGLQTGK